MASEKTKIRLQGHEKFVLREGWLSKGLNVINTDPFVFQGKDGPDVFGIGNNMVKSLRYWMKAFGLIEEKTRRGTILSDTGKIILAYDPYFEREFTLWLLHSNIAKNIEEATTWYLFFNRCDVEDLDKEQIEQIIIQEISRHTAGTAFSEKSVKSDIDVLLSMYSKTRQMNDPEDKGTSPFVQLKLVKNSEGRYSKIHPDLKSISEWNILYELAIMLKRTNSLSIEEVVSGENGLSKIYQVTTVVANELLDKLDALDLIRVNRTAGLDMIYKTKELTPINIISEYYMKNRMD